MNKSRKYIFVTGGVLSGVGKGITAASIGAVLQAKGVSVSVQKCDPYLNVDAGLLNPKEHGECFVTKDGAETDLDLGHYERFLDLELTQKNATLSGRLLPACLSVCMSPIFRKLLGICPVIREIGSSRRLRSSTARCGWHTDFSESIANGRLFSRTSRESSLD